MSSPYVSYARNSQHFDPNTPPPPPKPNSQDLSRRSTPAGSYAPLPPPKQDTFGASNPAVNDAQYLQHTRLQDAAHAEHIQDPGEQWLPKILEDKS